MMQLVRKEILGVIYYVKDLELASQWYCENLGFTIGDYDFNDFVELKVDGQYVMHLFKAVDLSPADHATFVFASEDIEKTHKILSEKNIDIQPLQHYGDHAAFNFKDCDGNVLMVYQTEWC